MNLPGILSNLFKSLNHQTCCFVYQKKKQYSRQPKSMVLKLSCASESAGGLVKTQITGFHHRVADSVGLG